MVSVHTYTQREKYHFQGTYEHMYQYLSYSHVLNVFTKCFYKKPLKCLLHVPLLLRPHLHPPVHWLEHVSLKTYMYEQSTNHICPPENWSRYYAKSSTVQNAFWSLPGCIYRTHGFTRLFSSQPGQLPCARHQGSSLASEGSCHVYGTPGFVLGAG